MDRVVLLAKAGMVTHSMEVVEVADITAAVAGPVSSTALYIAYFIIDKSSHSIFHHCFSS